MTYMHNPFMLQPIQLGKMIKERVGTRYKAYIENDGINYRLQIEDKSINGHETGKINCANVCISLFDLNEMSDEELEDILDRMFDALENEVDCLERNT